MSLQSRAAFIYSCRFPKSIVESKRKLPQLQLECSSPISFSFLLQLEQFQFIWCNGERFVYTSSDPKGQKHLGYIFNLD